MSPRGTIAYPAGLLTRLRSPLLPFGFFALFALVVLSGCSSPTDATTRAAKDGTAIAMYLEGVPVSHFALVGMLPGTELHISAGVKDDAGRLVSFARPSVVSRNPAAIAIDSTGLMRVVGRGSSWVVAAYVSANHGLISDSVTVSAVCTTLAVAGITVTVTDSVTGNAAGINALSISARSGNLRDSVFYANLPAGTGSYVQGLAYERPGTWDVRVTADGYKPWAALGVVVTKDLCHVIGMPLTARLQRL